MSPSYRARQFAESFAKAAQLAVDEHHAAGRSVTVMKDGQLQEILPPMNNLTAVRVLLSKAFEKGSPEEMLAIVNDAQKLLQQDQLKVITDYAMLMWSTLDALRRSLYEANPEDPWIEHIASVLQKNPVIT